MIISQIFVFVNEDLAIDGVPVVGLSAPVLLGLFVIMIFRGFIVPRKTYEDMKEDRDYWREAHKISEEARQIKDQQMEVVKEIGTTVTNFSRALDQVIRDQQAGKSQQGREKK